MVPGAAPPRQTKDTMTEVTHPAAHEAALAAKDHILGDVHAHVTLLEYGDYECPASIQAEPPALHLPP
jgi:protein-disulfide isomerase